MISELTHEVIRRNETKAIDIDTIIEGNSNLVDNIYNQNKYINFFAHICYIFALSLLLAANFL